MGRSIGMAAYRALTRRSTDRAFTPSGMRPLRDLVWIHAAEPDNILAILDLAQRLCTMRFDMHVLITLPDQATMDAARPNLPQQGTSFHRNIQLRSMRF